MPTARLFTLCVAACLSLTAAVAQTPQAPERSGVEVGAGLVCDTQEQAERFVSVLDRDIEAAASAVNAEVGDPTACILTGMVYVRGDQISKARGNGGAFNVLKIMVVGVMTEAGIRAIQPQFYFSVEKIEEIEA